MPGLEGSSDETAWPAVWLESAGDVHRGLFLQWLLGVNETGSSHPSSKKARNELILCLQVLGSGDSKKYLYLHSYLALSLVSHI